MSKNRKILFILPILTFVVLGAGIASAHNGFGFGKSRATPEEIAEKKTEMFEYKAEILGVSVDTVKDAWASGKSFVEIAEENGINIDELKVQMREKKMEQMEERLQGLVDSGVISQSQADEKLSAISERIANGVEDGKDFKRSHKGYGFRGFR